MSRPGHVRRAWGAAARGQRVRRGLGAVALAVALVAGLSPSSPAAPPAESPAASPAPRPSPGPTATALGGPVAAVTARAQQRRPNIVLVVLDDARLDDMSILRHVRRRVGNQGVTVTRHYAPYPLCCPARATLLTGKYAHNHQVLSNTAPGGGFTAFDDRSTLATWLDPTYRTGLVGKYLNQYTRPYVPPGWDEWMVPHRMYDYSYDGWMVTRDGVTTDLSLPEYQTDALGELAVDFIRRNAPRAQPFFLFTSIVGPHAGNPAEPDDPSLPTPAVSATYRDRFAGRPLTDPSFDEADISDKPAQLAPLTPAEVTALTEVNAQRREAELSDQDVIDEILDALRDSGELDRTFVIVTSDNGYLLGEHRIRGGKVSPYEVANHMPLLIRGPGIPRRSTFHGLNAQVDLAPTIARMAGLRIAPSWRVDGQSMLYRLRHPQARWPQRPGILLEAATPGDTSTWLYQGLVRGPWKYVERSNGFVELYNLRRDPYELRSRGAEPAYAEVVARLGGVLDDLRACAAATCRG
ncbi:sulfatase [Nocardioides sp.]|uniref:sulfatase family protein n=1 Tax=Nocardioides sp. TaxID=35761 RepID=UPI003528BD69